MSHGAGDRMFTVTDPANGEPLGVVPVCAGADVGRAVAAARDAAPGWAAVPAAERGAALHAAARAVEERGAEAGIGTLRQYAELLQVAWRTSRPAP